MRWWWLGVVCAVAAGVLNGCGHSETRAATPSREYSETDPVIVYSQQSRPDPMPPVGNELAGDAGQSGATAIVDIITAMSEGGLTSSDVTDRLSGAQLFGLRQAAHDVRACRASVLTVEGVGQVIAMQFKDDAAMDAFQRTGRQAVRVENVMLLSTEGTTDWNALVSFWNSRGGASVEAGQ